MQHRQDQGVILHIRPYRETSAILSILSRQNGLIRGVLRGYKRGSSSKKFSQVRPLSLVEFSFSGNSELKSLFSMDLIRSYGHIPAMLSYGLLLAEICHKLLPPEQEEEEIFEILAESLRLLNEENETGPLHIIHFILGFLLIQGYEIGKTDVSLDHLMAKSENARLSMDEQQLLLEHARSLLASYYPGKHIRSFNLLLSAKNEARGKH